MIDRIQLGKTGFNVSPVGFGSYRIDVRVPEHRRSLREALLAGCNLIDTSTNYTDGNSEKLVGEVLNELTTAKKIRREDMVVVTKVGYVQGQNMALVRRRETDGKPFSDVVKYSPDCWHCISPEFIADQITRSLERLALKRIDVLLLHNPEYFLKSGGDHAEYYKRIEAAFTHLEKEIADGRISWYGISSNTFPSPREDDEYTSFETVLEIADRVGKGFAVIQFPMNLFEPGAVLERNNSGKTVAELALTRGIGTLVNRPLNAFGPKGLVRLADFPSHDDRDIAGDLKAAWNRAMELEMIHPETKIAWGHIMRQNFNRINDLDSWRQLLEYRIQPELKDALEDLSEDPKTSEWAEEYGVVTRHLFDAFTAYLENQASHRSDQIAGVLDHSAPALRASKTLSQKAIRLYRSIPGIDCILLGMRRPEYVQDGLTLASPIPREQAIGALEAVARSTLGNDKMTD